MPETNADRSTSQVKVHYVDKNVTKEYKSEEKVNTLVEYLDKIKMEMRWIGGIPVTYMMKMRKNDCRNNI